MRLNEAISKSRVSDHEGTIIARRSWVPYLGLKIASDCKTGDEFVIEFTPVAKKACKDKAFFEEITQSFLQLYQKELAQESISEWIVFDSVEEWESIHPNYQTNLNTIFDGITKRFNAFEERFNYIEDALASIEANIDYVIDHLEDDEDEDDADNIDVEDTQQAPIKKDKCDLCNTYHQNPLRKDSPDFLRELLAKMQ